jgi:F5/8 type C domain
MRMSKLFSGVALTMILAVSSAQASVIYPTSAAASSSHPGYEANFAIDTGPGSAVTDWANNGVGAGSWLQLNLGAVYSLADAYVTDRVTSTGPNGAFAGGLNDFTTEFKLQAYTDGTFSTPLFPAVFFSPQFPPNCNITPSCFLSIVSLGGLSAQYIEYTIVSQNESLGTFNNAGLSDIHFLTAAPLPPTWTMLIAGFVGLFGFVAFGGKKRNAATIAVT